MKHDPNIEDLINRLRRSRGTGPTASWGGGLLLVGAGCSVSAGIPSALGIVDLALQHLAAKRLPWINIKTTKPQEIYDKLKVSGLDFKGSYGADIYYEIFDNHLDETNEQRLLIKHAVDLGKSQINWTHIRIGQ